MSLKLAMIEKTEPGYSEEHGKKNRAMKIHHEMVQHCNRLPRESGQSLSLEIFKACVDTVLSNLT